MCFQLGRVKEAALRKGGIDRRSRMTLAEYKSVALRPLRILWVIAHYICIKHGNNIGNRHYRADVTAAREMSHLDAVTADKPRKLNTVHYNYLIPKISFMERRCKNGHLL